MCQIQNILDILLKKNDKYLIDKILSYIKYKCSICNNYCDDTNYCNYCNLIFCSHCCEYVLIECLICGNYICLNDYNTYCVRCIQQK